jgi:hypothetical protein
VQRNKSGKQLKIGVKTIVICITRLETVILQVRERFVGRGVSRGATSATVSGRAIHKHFPDNHIFKAKDNNFC